MNLNSDKNVYSVDDVVKWFFERYESPKDAGVPYDSVEKKYVYFYGEQYEAEDEIYSKLPGIDYETLQIAVSQIERDGSEWVNKEEWAKGKREKGMKIKGNSEKSIGKVAEWKDVDS